MLASNAANASETEMADALAAAGAGNGIGKLQGGVMLRPRRCVVREIGAMSDISVKRRKCCMARGGNYSGTRPDCARGKAGKQLFFEKNNQKTFLFLGPRQTIKSFLVLFFKKELLLLESLRPAPGLVGVNVSIAS
jgi:hypothetical protein